MTDNTAYLTRFRAGVRALFCVLVCCAIAMPLCASPASAEVRKADIVAGQSVEARDLSVSQSPNVDAAFAVLMDGQGNVLFERDADMPTKIASVTKVMTAVVALDSVPVDTQITVSDTAAAIGESSASLQSGDVMTLDQALHALLIPSGNDAAEAIAESVGALMIRSTGGDASDPAVCSATFVDAMNKKAAELGCTDTVFANPHGLDDEGFEGDHHSTARDVAIFCRYAMSKQLIRDIVGGGDGTCTVTRAGQSTSLDLATTDVLIGNYDGACGIKTGYTQLAGACFAGACNRDGVEYYAISLNASDLEARFTDAQAMFNWAYEHCVDYTPINAPSTTTGSDGQQVPLVASVAQSDWVDCTIAATVDDPSLRLSILDIDGNVSQRVDFSTVSGDVHVGDKLGTISFIQHNNTLATMDIIATENVSAPNFFEGIGVWWDRLWRGFSGDDGVATSVCYNTTPLIIDKTAA